MPANKSLYNIIILFVLLGGMAIRLTYVLQLENKLWWEDEVDYLALGQSIATGQGFTVNGEPTAFRPPGYPLLLAGLAKLGLDSVVEIRFVQIFLNALTLFFLFLLSLKIAGPVAALVSTTVAAVYPYFIFGVGTLFALTWFSFTLVISVYFLIRGLEGDKKSLIALAGLFMGLSILTRTSAAVLGIMTLVWLFLVLRLSKKFIVTAIVFGATIAIVVAPWLIRNYIVFGKPMLSTNGGRNLWLGNNPESTINSGSDIPMPAALQLRIDAASEIDADAIYNEVAINHIKSDPLHYVVLTIHKALAFWRFDPSPTTDGYPRYKNLYSIVSILSFAPIFFLALAGLWLANPSQRRIMLLWILYAVAFTMLHAVYITKVRFRLPLDYFLILMAGSAIACIAQRSLSLKRLFPMTTGYVHAQETASIFLPFTRRR